MDEENSNLEHDEIRDLESALRENFCILNTYMKEKTRDRLKKAEESRDEWRRLAHAWRKKAEEALSLRRFGN